MCGINGILSFHENAQIEHIIPVMNQALSHRGPDEEGEFFHENIQLGHRRLSIIDLSPLGKQPMMSHDNRLVIVFNGEIYNYNALKSKIDYPFKSQTDTEVILAYYMKYKEACVDFLNGMFAFAIWDQVDKTLFIARDRLGIKPLYYYIDNQKLIFSSELRALLSTNLIARKMNVQSLVDYVRYQTVHAPNTMIEGVNMLMPGHFMLVKQQQVTFKKYWDINKTISNQLIPQNYQEAVKEVRNKFEEAVKLRLVADVPFGAFLSGGIDSSAIVAMMSKNSSRSIDTFSVVFEEEHFSEEQFAELIAKKYNTNHHTISLKPQDFLNDLPSALDAFDHPSADGINTYVVAKHTRLQGVKMALSGLGGDEIFGGYDIFSRSNQLINNNSLQYAPYQLRKMAGNLFHQYKNTISSKKIAAILALKELKFKQFYPINRQVFLDDEVSKILNIKNLPSNSVASILQDFDEKEEYIYTLVSKGEVSTYMQNVLLRDADQMTMAHALEVRVPFLDYQLVSYVLSLPDKFKLSRHANKQLLVDSMGDLLPKEIYSRKKMGFVLPWELWMKNDLNDLCVENLNYLKSISYINANQIDFLWKQFISGNKSVNWSRIWGLVSLAHWLKLNKIE
jgi:asparagine synthase (glutamine-hydrolysing)